MYSDFAEERFQVAEEALLDANVRMPASVSDRVPSEPDWHLANVPDGFPLCLEKLVFPVRGKQEKESLESEVLQVRNASGLSSRAGRFADCDSVLLDDPPVDFARIFSLGNLARDIKEVPVADVGHSKLLHEACNTRCFTTVLHRPPKKPE